MARKKIFTSTALGIAGETVAEGWYRDSGYCFVDRRWRVRQGEIDLIFSKGSIVVFIEVKTRTSSFFGTGFDAVDYRKQMQVRRVARLWLASSEKYFSEIRFDVAAVTSDGSVQVLEGCF